jgi:hypothetical protein
MFQYSRPKSAGHEADLMKNGYFTTLITFIFLFIIVCYNQVK